MARVNSALYLNETIDAFEVDDNYSYYKKDEFKCPVCKVKLQFNRGINFLDPHFKNWPNVDHLITCGINVNNNQFNKYGNQNINIITSTILPRAKRLTSKNDKFPTEILIKRYYGRRSKKFLNALNKLTENEINTLTLITEDGKTVRLNEIILRQDDIIEKLEKEKAAFICILKGYTNKTIDVRGSKKNTLTYNGRYKNTNKFDLFIPASFVEKNEVQIENIENKLIYCYGIAEKNQYGYKMNVYSIEHQICIIRQ